MSAAKLRDLRERRAAFVEVRNTAKSRLEFLEERFVETLLAGEPVNRGILADARGQLAIAEADLAMVDRILDRWASVH